MNDKTNALTKTSPGEQTTVEGAIYNATSELLPEQTTGLKAILYWFLAAVFFTLAMIGVILPGIPTTPFLLLMCYFLLRVSPALHAKALRWPIVGGPLRDWREQGGVKTNVKAYACCMVTVLVGITLFWTPLSPLPKTMIFLAAAYGIFYVIRLPTASASNTSPTIGKAVERK